MIKGKLREQVDLGRQAGHFLQRVSHVWAGTLLLGFVKTAHGFGRERHGLIALQTELLWLGVFISFFKHVHQPEIMRVVAKTQMLPQIVMHTPADFREQNRLEIEKPGKHLALNKRTTRRRLTEHRTHLGRKEEGGEERLLLILSCVAFGREGRVSWWQKGGWSLKKKLSLRKKKPFQTLKIFFLLNRAVAAGRSNLETVDGTVGQERVADGVLLSRYPT